ncbi:MAG: hypothetical protein ABSH48_21950 [Verrucomicrobiota bacterium]|jgi:hypothetical protein
MSFVSQHFAIFLSAALLTASTIESSAFALLGPIQPWMQMTNGVISSDDIGGPMYISNGYRWNVPVITYGFDQSFLDYFGSNGVAAVESAIQLLNDLPPASQIVLTNYPYDSRHQNFEAQAQSLFDLKSQTVALLLEHLGLAQPTPSIYVLRQWNPILTNESSLLLAVFSGTTLTNYIVTLNYDPQNLAPSPYVNETLYSGQEYDSVHEHAIFTSPAYFGAEAYDAVADDLSANRIGTGDFYTGLTYDDVGGLAYLLSTNNVNYEPLLSGVVGAGTNANSFVNGAWRPGVDKIIFIRQKVDSQSGAFLPTTNSFTDNYLVNGRLRQQQMARIIWQPDFIFSAGDVTTGTPELQYFSRTGTTNWLNDATANGNTNDAGPGIIEPPVQIVFNKLGRMFFSDSHTSENQALDDSQFWGSFDGSTNAPFIYPILQTGTNQMTVRLWLTESSPKRIVWEPKSLSGTLLTMQTSANFTNWTTLFTVTNNGSVCTYFNDSPTSTSRFYQLISN